MLKDTNIELDDKNGNDHPTSTIDETDHDVTKKVAPRSKEKTISEVTLNFVFRSFCIIIIVLFINTMLFTYRGSPWHAASSRS